MADKVYASIIDAILDEREPSWDEVGLSDAQKSGEKVKDLTGQYADDTFLDDIAGESHHTELPSDSKSATLLNRISEKESASPRLGSGQTATTHLGARPEDYKNSIGDDESLFSEVTMGLGEAESQATVEKRNRTDGEIKSYIRTLLNQGMPPARVAAQLKKLAEIELFNHQMGTKYLNENAGLMGLAYLEPNTFMDKSSPAYEREKVGGLSPEWCPRCKKDVNATTRQGNTYCPECEEIIFGTTPYGRAAAKTSADCIRQHETWKQAGIQVRAQSVKKVIACDGCSFFKEKTCNLYHLPVVSSAAELTPIVNKMTAGIPAGFKRAALVKIANREPQRTPMVSFARDPRGYAKASVSTIEGVRGHRKEASGFDYDEVETLHKQGVALADIYEKGSTKVGSVQAGWAIKKFVSSLRDKGTKIALSQIDCTLLKQKLGVSNAIVGAIKCADCIYRSDMHCGLTGGTLLTFPGMEKTGKTASAAPEDVAALLKDYELVKKPEQADIEINGPDRLEIEMGNKPSAGDI